MRDVLIAAVVAAVVGGLVLVLEPFYAKFLFEPQRGEPRFDRIYTSVLRVAACFVAVVVFLAVLGSFKTG